MGDYFGWDTIFYTFGSAGCIWFVFWVFFVFDTPDDHPRISEVRSVYLSYTFVIMNH
jgi:ACS family sodium-dependent inorganic phosphate cotransporter-like MFS transporter 5